MSQDETGSKPAGKNSKLKGKRGRSNGHKEQSPSIKMEGSPLPSDANGVGPGFSPSSVPEMVEGSRILSPRERKDISEELQLCDTDLANVKFKMSPSEAMQYLESASTTVPQLFKYDSLRERSAQTPGKPQRENCSTAEGRAPSLTNVPGVRHAQAGGSDAEGRGHSKRGVVRNARAGGSDAEECGHSKGGVVVKLSSEDGLEESQTLAKKVCLKGAGLTNLARGGGGNLSTPPLTPITPSHPHSQPPSRHHSPAHLHSQPPSRQHSPEPVCTNNMSAYDSPYVTPHGTPTHTPLQSPLSSPTALLSHPGSYHHHHAHPVSHPNMSLQGGVPSSGASSAKLPGENWPHAWDFHASSSAAMSGGIPQVQLQPQPAANQGIVLGLAERGAFHRSTPPACW